MLLYKNIIKKGERMQPRTPTPDEVEQLARRIGELSNRSFDRRTLRRYLTQAAIAVFDNYVTQKLLIVVMPGMPDLFWAFIWDDKGQTLLVKQDTLGNFGRRRKATATQVKRFARSFIRVNPK